MIDIRTKISGLILNKEGKLLIFRNKDKTIWTCPGGKIEEGESDLECLKRELSEEASIELQRAKFLLETPVEPAAGNPGKFVIMKFYIVETYSGTPEVNSGDSVEEMRWISRSEFENEFIKDKISEIGSGLAVYAIPKLIEMGLMK